MKVLDFGIARVRDGSLGKQMATRAGMGLCQGRVCAPAVQHLLAAAAGIAPGDIPPPTARVPLRPMPLDALTAMAAD